MVLSEVELRTPGSLGPRDSPAPGPRGHRWRGRAGPMGAWTPSGQACTGCLQHVAGSRLRQERGLCQRWPPLRAVPATRSCPGLQGVVRDRRSPSGSLREASSHSFPLLYQPKLWGTLACPPALGPPGRLRLCVLALCQHRGRASPGCGDRPSFALRHSTNRLPPSPRCGSPAWGQACPLVGTLNLEPQRGRGRRP